MFDWEGDGPRVRFGFTCAIDGFEWRESACPGCGRRARLRGTSNVRLEWARIADGRYNGYLVTPALLVVYSVYDFQYESDTGISQMAGESAHPLTLPPEFQPTIEEMLEGQPRERRSVWHECSSGDGGAAAVPARPPRRPPSRFRSAQRDTDDDS